MAAPVTKKIELDLDGLNDNQKDVLKTRVGNYVVNEILRYVSSGNSPVKGNGRFKSLNKKYADEQKGGNRTPNLELFGDMLDALEFKKTKDGVEIGVFDPQEADKALGHNSGFEGHPYLEGKAPKRQFIPDEDQDFKQNIRKGVKDIEQGIQKATDVRFPIRTELPEETGILSEDIIRSFFPEFLR
jgi:hypothetical protein